MEVSQSSEQRSLSTESSDYISSSHTRLIGCANIHAKILTEQPLTVQAGWDENKVNVTERDFDRMTWQALQNPSIAEKAALHAHAMSAALLGKDFVIPPGPGVSFYVPGMAWHGLCAAIKSKVSCHSGISGINVPLMECPAHATARI